MSLIPLMNFISRHGIVGIIEMTRMLNADMPHKDIADRFGMCVSRFSELHHILYLRVYALRPDVQHFLDALEYEHERLYEEQKRGGADACKVIALAGAGAQKD